LARCECNRARSAPRVPDRAAEGLGQGEARVLLRLLTLKFGPVPEAILAHVESADAETLLRWSERVLSADDLEAVFRA
jgi:hypothetical protein